MFSKALDNFIKYMRDNKYQDVRVFLFDYDEFDDINDDEDADEVFVEILYKSKLKHFIRDYDIKNMILTLRIDNTVLDDYWEIKYEEYKKERDYQEREYYHMKKFW